MYLKLNSNMHLVEDLQFLIPVSTTQMSQHSWLDFQVF